MTVGVATNSREMSNYYHFDSGKDGKLSAALMLTLLKSAILNGMMPI